MKRNLLKEKWRKQGDVFSHTQGRLTFYYSGILSLFLILFVGIFLVILYNVIMNDQVQRLETLADREIMDMQHSPDFDQDHHPPKQDRKDGPKVFLSENQLFYYVISNDKQLVKSNEAIEPLHSLFLKQISDWNPKVTEIKQVAIQIPNNHEYQQFKGFDIRALILARPVTIHGQNQGTMYIGLDISSFHKIFQWLMIVLCILALIFIGVAVWISYVMSKKALIPIQKSYHQQREFVANASHELRTPLSVIFSSIEALELNLEDEEDPFTKKILKGLKLEIKRMTRLINDLLTLARSDDQTKAEIIRDWFDIYHTGWNVQQSLAKLAADKKIDIILQGTEPTMVFADKDKLYQLLYILVDNAIKYTPVEGKVVITLKTAEQKSHCQLRMSVRDSGVGVSKEERERIFDRFYRVNKARTRKEGGHGLGLSIAKWIVDSHNGTITVNSEVGKGTEFVVAIPFDKKS